MQRLLKFFKSNFLFLAVLFCAIIVRLLIFDYPLTQEETNRDFLITRHMAENKELVTFGPRNGTLPGLGNSPAYYYLLTLIFSVFDNVMFVSTINFFLQIAALVLVYLIVKELFGKETALISSIFLAFSKTLILTSKWVWQPYLMYFFMVLSFYLLFLSYQKRSPAVLLAAIVVFTFSLALHMSAFGILPAFLVVVFMVLKAQRASLHTKIFALLTFVFLGALFFIPQIIKVFSDYRGLVSLSPHAFVSSSKEFLVNLGSRLSLLATAFNPIFISVLLPVFLFYLKIVGKNRGRKNVYLFLIFCLFSFLIIFSLFNGRLLDQHFYPLYPLVAVLGAEAISKTFSSRPPWGLAKYALVGFLAINLITGVKEMLPLYPFEKLKAARQISGILASEIKKIKDEESRDNLNFFQFRVYAPAESAWFEGNESIIDSIYWVLILDQFRSPFIKILKDDTIVQSKYGLLNSDEYIFIVCINYASELEEERECLRKFKTEHKAHNVLRKLPDKVFNQSFYVAGK